MEPEFPSGASVAVALPQHAKTQKVLFRRMRLQPWANPLELLEEECRERRLKMSVPGSCQSWVRQAFGLHGPCAGGGEGSGQANPWGSRKLCLLAELWGEGPPSPAPLRAPLRCER